MGMKLGLVLGGGAWIVCEYGGSELDLIKEHHRTEGAEIKCLR
jgi:hypothetical protein